MESAGWAPLSADPGLGEISPSAQLMTTTAHGFCRNRIPFLSIHDVSPLLHHIVAYLRGGGRVRGNFTEHFYIDVDWSVRWLYRKN